MNPLHVPNFRSIGAHISVLRQILQSVQKVEEKMKKLKQTFGCSYLGMS